MSIIHGGNIIVSKKVGNSYTAFAAAKSCDVEVNNNDIEVSSATDAQWEHRIAGRKSWKVTVNGLLTVLADTLLQSGEEYQLRIALRAGGDMVTGYALCKTAKVTGTQGNLGQYNCTFNGSGELS